MTGDWANAQSPVFFDHSYRRSSVPLDKTKQVCHSPACSAKIMNYEFKIMNCLGGVVERGRSTSYFCFAGLFLLFYSFTFLLLNCSFTFKLLFYF